MPTAPFKDPVFVSRPLLPSLDTLVPALSEIWEAKWLTNMGAKHIQLEQELKRELNASNISLFNNGTIALLAAIKSLSLSGEVITTPFTFAATPHSLTWQNIKPIFCDIDAETLTIDPKKIESLITGKTTGILGVHVYGNPCDVHAIDLIAKKYNLKVIYDAAHAFGTEINGQGIANFGDITMFSFHATKLFHSAEGGCLATKDQNLKYTIDLLKNFGIKNEEEVVSVGINGKLSEPHSAIGLLVLDLIASERSKRSRIKNKYKECLNDVPGISIFETKGTSKDSFQYLVAIVDEDRFGRSRNAVFEELRRHNVIARKYFFPLCSNFPIYKDFPSAHPTNLPVANLKSEQVLALPFYGELSLDSVEKICEIIKGTR